MSRTRHRLNVAGPFYVEDGCCTLCGVPDVEAPELFGTTRDSCFVRRQPETTGEVDRMLSAMITSEVSCIRYCGSDTDVIRRLAEQDEAGLSDTQPQAFIPPAKRDHVGLRAPTVSSARALADDFVAHLRKRPMPERYRVNVTRTGSDRCDLAIAWYQDVFHPISFQRSPVPEFDWLIVGLEFSVHDWLADRSVGEATFFHAEDWAGSRSNGSAVAW